MKLIFITYRDFLRFVDKKKKKKNPQNKVIRSIRINRACAIFTNLWEGVSHAPFALSSDLRSLKTVIFKVLGTIIGEGALITEITAYE